MTEANGTFPWPPSQKLHHTAIGFVTMVSAITFPFFVVLIWRKSTREMHAFRAYLLLHSCWSFSECLLNGLVLSTPLHPLDASWVSGPLRFFGDVRGLRFSIIATCLTASRVSITFLFVLRYAALRPSGLLYRTLAHPWSGTTLFILVLTMAMTGVLIPFNLSVWDPEEIRAFIRVTNPSLADFLEDKVVFGFRSGPGSLLRVAIFLSAAITLLYVLVEVLCVVLSHRFLNSHVPRRNSDGSENRTYVMTKNFLNALISEQVRFSMVFTFQRYSGLWHETLIAYN